MKKLLLCLMCLFFMITPVSADMGPKPSVKIDIKGLEGERYFVTLLSKEESTGPHSVVEDLDEVDKTMENYDVFLKFYDYKDDYYFLGQFTFMDCSDSHYFEWIYFPPEDFKILIYLVDEDRFICSDIYSRYAFTSTYKATINNNKIDVEQTGEIEIIEGSSLGIKQLSLRIFVTVFIEVIIALYFKINTPKALLIIGITNIITQFILNLLLCSVLFTYCLFIFEILVVVIEYFVYKLYFKDIPKKTILSYVIIANILSFGIGQILLHLFPNVF